VTTGLPLEQLVRSALESNDPSCLHLLLVLASLSVSSNKAHAAAWMDAGLHTALTTAFSPEECTHTRKLAFDLAFAIVHSRMIIATSERVSCPVTDSASHDFGFERLVLHAGGAGCAAAAREYQLASLFVVSALCASGAHRVI
jgi:hypothetical protein